jgi:hypothetical protein
MPTTTPGKTMAPAPPSPSWTIPLPTIRRRRQGLDRRGTRRAASHPPHRPPCDRTGFRAGDHYRQLQFSTSGDHAAARLRLSDNPADARCAPPRRLPSGSKKRFFVIDPQQRRPLNDTTALLKFAHRLPGGRDGSVASAEDKIGQAWLMRRRPRRVSASRSNFSGFRFPPDGSWLRFAGICVTGSPTATWKNCWPSGASRSIGSSLVHTPRVDLASSIHTAIPVVSAALLNATALQSWSGVRLLATVGGSDAGRHPTSLGRGGPLPR